MPVLRCAQGRTRAVLAGACIALVLVAGCSGSTADDAVIEIPATFDHHRVLVRPVTTDGAVAIFELPRS